MVQKTIASIDFLRVISIGAIAFYHFSECFNLYPLEYVSINSKLVTIAVSVFFVISGFLTGYRKRDSVKTVTLSDCVSEWKRKILKFYPAYFIMLLVAAMLRLRTDFIEGLTLSRISKNALIGVVHLLLLQVHIPDATSQIALAYNGPAWSLSTITALYFLSPALVCLFGKIKNNTERFQTIIVLLIIRLIGGAIAELFDLQWWLLYFSVFGNGIVFSIGMILGMTFAETEHIQQKALWNKKTLFLGILYVLCLGMAITKSKIYLVQLTGILGALFVWGIINAGGKIKAVFESPLFGTLSRYSFEFYICHQMVYAIVLLFMNPQECNHLLAQVLCWTFSGLTAFLLNKLNFKIQQSIHKTVNQM